MIRVTQFYGEKKWRTFIVKNPKKIEFWIAVSLMRTVGYVTKIKQL